MITIDLIDEDISYTEKPNRQESCDGRGNEAPFDWSLNPVEGHGAGKKRNSSLPSGEILKAGSAEGDRDREDRPNTSLADG